jgi:hypothetical protein
LQDLAYPAPGPTLLLQAALKILTPEFEQLPGKLTEERVFQSNSRRNKLAYSLHFLYTSGPYRARYLHMNSGFATTNLLNCNSTNDLMIVGENLRFTRNYPLLERVAWKPQRLIFFRR